MSEGMKTIIYPVKDLARAKTLYSKLLGVEPEYDHTYYVGFKADAVLVHNAGCLIDSRKLDYLFNVNIKADDHNSPRAGRHSLRVVERGPHAPDL